MRIRSWQPDDLTALQRINEACVPAMNSLRIEALYGLLSQAFAGLVAEDAGGPLGFVICLAEGAHYDSPNYRWFAERYESFAYVDRVAVAPEARGGGVGAALYDDLQARLAGRRPVLLCEVNELPPNPGSLRFHQRQGFREVGRQAHDDGAVQVIKLEKKLPLAMAAE